MIGTRFQRFAAAMRALNPLINRLPLWFVYAPGRPRRGAALASTRAGSTTVARSAPDSLQMRRKH
jgi:hypothetical protein